jgi:Skp family chaperone for outer membrane proteins
MTKKSLVRSLVIGMITFAFMSNTCSAQKLQDNQVPQAVKSAQEAKFPGMKVKWEKEGKDFEAAFTKDGKKMSAVFDAKGTWKETETDIKASELPKAVTDYMMKTAKAKSIKEAAIVNKADGSTVYEAEANGKDYVFDSTGKFLKAEKDED